jgi:type I restriction enzyme S subunit
MRIKDVVTLRNEKTTNNTMPYIALENIISWDAKYIESNSETEGTNSVFKKGDVLFGKLRPYLAKGFCPTYDGICSTEFFVMTPNKGYSSRFLLYYFLSVPFIDYIKNRVAGVKMPRTSWDEFGSISINLPSFPDQQRIVDSLDKKLAIIDHRVEVLEKQRAAYARLKKTVINQAVTRGLNLDVKLKNSGVDWIGMIPEHWDIRRIKDLVSINKNSLGEDTDEAYKFRYIDISNVSGEGEIKLSDEMYFYEAPSRARRIVKRGDVIVSTVRTYLRAIACIDFEAVDIIASTGFAVLTPTKCVCSSYLAYLTRSSHIVDSICSQSTGVSYPAISSSKLSAIYMPLPPFFEQKAIADYLDEKCAKIDAAIENIEKQIKASGRLKKAIINEAISGNTI